ncbi:MAG: anthranilate synthase component I family protein [Myxococcota bacterium]
MATVPGLERFAELAAHARVVPVSEELVADDLTPVRAFAAVGDGPGSFLLESVVGGEKWARYSFVGAAAPVLLRGHGTRWVRTEDGVATEHHGDAYEEGLRQELAAWAPPPAEALAELGLPRFWGGAVGFLAYDAVRRFEPSVGAPVDAEGDEELHFAFGGPLLVFDALRQTLRIIVPQRTDVPGAHAAARATIAALRARLASPPPLAPLAMPDPVVRGELPPSSFAREDFETAVRKSRAHIVEGDIFQVVLSQRFAVPTEGATAFDVYRALRVVNPSPYMYFLRLPGVEVAGASPETLVRVEDGEATLRPIAGTRPRGATEAEDRAAEAELLADPKERAEHVMLVDLGRNDLGRISAAGTVRITEKMVIERYSHVMHMTSNVRGTLAPGRDALSVLRAVFPAGTLSGAPKVRAMQIIEALEPVRRGVYGGAVGYLGFDGNADLAIAIRTVVAKDGMLTLQAGAGLVEASDPAKEFEETVAKARAGLVAIEAARRSARYEP